MSRDGLTPAGDVAESDEYMPSTPPPMLAHTSPLLPGATFRLGAAVALCFLALSAAVAPASSSASHRVQIQGPAVHTLDGDRLPFWARTTPRARAVSYWVDGRHMNVDRRAPWRFDSGGQRTRRAMSPGLHKLKVRAWWQIGSRHFARETSRWVRVRPKTTPPNPTPAPTPNPTPAPTPNPTPTVPNTSIAGADWGSDFESGGFGEWSWWGQGDSSYTGLSVVDPADRGAPRLSGRAARFQTTDSDIAAGRINSKLYKFFHSGTGDRTNFTPKAATGTYSARYYIPSNYSIPNTRVNGRNRYVNIFQWKDNYWLDSSKTRETSDPTWWLELGSAGAYGVDGVRSDHPVALVHHWQDWTKGYSDYRYPMNPVPVPLGRWFQVEAKVVEDQYIDFFVDGKHLVRAENRSWPVGTWHQGSFQQIFGVGHYATNAGSLMVDQVTYRRP